PFTASRDRQSSWSWVTARRGCIQPFEWWEIDARGGRYQNKTTFIDLPDAADPCPFPPCEFPARFDVQRWEAELLSHFHIGKWSTSTIGGEYRAEDGVAQGSTGFDASSHTWSGLVHHTVRFS